MHQIVGNRYRALGPVLRGRDANVLAASTALYLTPNSELPLEPDDVVGLHAGRFVAT